ncbi:MAG: YggS family pyridoxal phosphate-dependent enzyme [Acidimicrobiia bacterium]
MIDVATVADHVAAVRARIAAAGGRDVELVAVTKTFPVEAIRAAVAAGCRAIGENYAQELVAKIAELERGGIDEGERPEVHFIGHLQTNKVRMLAPVVTVWESVDRPSVVDEIEKRAPGARIYVQVNVTGEPQKSGCRPDEAAALVRRATDAGLQVEGLMTIGVLDDPVAARAGFRLLRGLSTSLGLRGCSMGMTDDLEIAVEEGATLVRVGRALFGPRVRDVDRDLR